jgi:Nickel responsive protein SCO4226-like
LLRGGGPVARRVEVGTLEREQLRGAAAKSSEALAELGPEIQWVEPYVADNKTSCVYLSASDDLINKHA